MAEREDRMRDRQYQRAREGFTVSQGTPMALWCPQCSRPHVDEGEWAHRAHRTHMCATCGHEWTPYDYTTVGVPHGLLPGVAVTPQFKDDTEARRYWLQQLAALDREHRERAKPIMDELVKIESRRPPSHALSAGFPMGDFDIENHRGEIG